MLVLLLLGCDRGPSSAATGGSGETTELAANNDRLVGSPPTVATPSLAAIRAAHRAGRHDETLSMAQAYLIAHPGDPEALFLSAQSLLASGREVQAIETLQLVPHDDPQFGLTSLGQLADWHLRSGHPAEAERQFRRLLEVHGDVALAHSRIALLMNSQGKRFEAMPHLVALAQMQDITLRELAALVTISDQCSVEKVPGTTGSDGQWVEGDLRRARQLGMTGKWDEGLELTQQLRDRFPESTAIAAYLGNLYVNLQRVEELDRWHASLPDGIHGQPEYWSTMARWMALVGKHEEAVRCACESIRRDATSALVYETLARSLRVLGREQEATVADERAKILAATRHAYVQTLLRDPTADDYSAVCEGMIALRRPFEALGWLREAAKLGAAEAQIKRLTHQLQNYDPPTDRDDWLVCGLNVDRFPLPGSAIAGENPSRDAQRSSAERRIELVEMAATVGIDFQYDPGNERSDGSYLLHQTMGGGIGVLDYDRDGWPDLYFAQGGGEAFSDENRANQLLRNLGGTTVVDVTGPAAVDDRHYGQGVTAADWNQDGFVDLIVANIGPNVFFRNNGDGTFTAIDVPAWEASPHWTSTVLCGDLSGDGIADLLECNYIDDRRAMTVRCTPSEQLCAPTKFQPAVNRVLRGHGDGTFELWPGAQPLERDASYSLGAILGNVDGLQGNDAFIANDTRENSLWISSPGTDSESDRYTLRQEARLRGCAAGPLGEAQGCMGIATGDFDHTGTFDMYVTNYYNEAANLYLQQESGLFVDSAALLGARQPSVQMVGFGTQAADLDRDGWLDLVVLNGHAVDRRDQGEPLQMLPQLFRGGPAELSPLKPQGSFWNTPALGRTVALLDWDRDGQVDMVANHLDQPVALLKNQSVGGNWIQLELVGVECERDAVGAKVTVECGERSWVSWVTAGAGYFSSNEPVVDFGIGDAAKVDRVQVEWPLGESEEIRDLQANRRYLVIQRSDGAYHLEGP